MLSKNELKYIQSLCQKKQRLAEGLFLAEGVKLVNELLLAGYPVQQVYATPEWEAPIPELPLTRVTEEELTRMSSLHTPHQVLAVARQRTPSGAPVWKGQLTLVLDGIQDPGNMGTLIRIADWFGIKQLVVSDDTVELYNPKVIQSTMGSFLRVNCWYGDLKNLLTSADVPVYGALLNGANLYETGRVTEGALVIGNESKGIRDQVLPLIQHAVTIPRIGQAESLNAAVATGILLSHLTK